MASPRTLLRAFSGGELSPTMAGRPDDQRFQTGAATMRNMVCLPHGPVRNRPGFKRCAVAYGASNSAARLVTFKRSTQDALALEIGYDAVVGGYIRQFASGAAVTFDTASVRPFLTQKDALVYSVVAGDYNVAYVMPYQAATVFADIDVALNRITAVGHGFATGDRIGVASDGAYPTTVPGGLISSTSELYAIRVDDDTFGVATTYANALASVGINITVKPAATLYWAAYDMFADDDGFRLTGSLPAPLSTTRTYYARRLLTSIAYEVWLDRGGVVGDSANLDVHDAFPGTALSNGFHRYYLHGELASNGGNYYTAKQPISATTFSGSQWLQQGTDLHYVISAPWAAADLFEVNYTPSNDVMTFVHPSYPMRELRRWSATHWELAVLDLAATIRPPLGLTGTPDYGFSVTPSAGTVGAPFTLGFAREPVQYPINAGDRVHVKVSGMTINGDAFDHDLVVLKVNATTIELGSTTDGGVLSNTSPYTVAGTFSATGSYLRQLGDYLGEDTQQAYKVTAVDDRARESLPSDELTVSNNLYVEGASNLIAWQPVGGASEYRIYKRSDGVFGLIGSVDASGTLEFTDDNIAPDHEFTTPYYDSVLAGAEYPGAVGYFQQRRLFARTTTYPQNVWGTVSGTESDMQFHLPTVDSDRLSFQVASRETEIIRHIVGMDALLLLTDQTEYRVSPVNSDVLTPSNIDVRPQSLVGCSPMRPIVVGRSILFGAARGGHLYETGYQSEAGGYLPFDLSIRAQHLFDNLALRDGGLMRAPYQIAWFTSSGGKLLGLTHVPEQQVSGWHRHDIAGASFESVCVVPEGNEDRLYAVILRGGVRSIQRMGAFEHGSIANAFFVDDGVTTTADSSGVVTGLSALAGSTVEILADGVVQTAQAVTAAGKVTMDTRKARSVVHVGLPIAAQIQSMPVTMQIEAYAQGRQKNISDVWVRVNESGQFKIGPSLTDLVPSDASIPVETITSTEVQVMPTGDWDAGGQFWVVQDAPLPLTVLGMTLRVSIGG